MRGFLLVIPFFILHVHILAQGQGSMNYTPTISCTTKEVILGVNWHFKEPFVCSENIYFPYEVFHSYPTNYMYYTGLTHWINYTGPYMFYYQIPGSFNDWVNSGIYHYVGNFIKNPFFDYLENKYSGFYYTDSSGSILDYARYQDIIIVCDSILGKEDIIELIPKQLGIWQWTLSQNMDSAEVKTAIKNLDFEKFDNYYPIPISDAWRDTTYDYFKQVSKVFYLLLFKCKITYLEGAYIGFDLPNTNLDLNSDNAADRSFCKRVSIPYFPIVNIEDVEPYNPRIENK